MIVFEHLAKRYGSLKAVDDLSFTVKPGRVTGFLGPNGAGKTTTMRMSTNLIRSDAGRATFYGREYAKLVKPLTKVGVALEPVVFHPGRTAMDHLMMLAPYAGVGRGRCQEVLNMVGLSEVGPKRLSQFSLGMRGRLNLAAALMGDPGIMMLDEPVNGLDPEGIRWMRELLRGLAGEGRTILISSHLLSEIEQTVDDLVIIAHGKLVYAGPLAELEGSRTPVVAVKVADVGALHTLAMAHGWAVREQTSGGAVLLEGPTPAEVGRATLAAGIPLESLAAHASDLESLFLELTEGQGDMR